MSTNSTVSVWPGLRLSAVPPPPGPGTLAFKLGDNVQATKGIVAAPPGPGQGPLPASALPSNQQTHVGTHHTASDKTRRLLFNIFTSFQSSN